MKRVFSLLLCFFILCVSCNKATQKAENENQDAEVQYSESDTMVEPVSEESEIPTEDEDAAKTSVIVALDSVAALPKGCNEDTAFGFVLDYKGYVFEATLYPLHDYTWIVLSHWCLDEDETIYIEDTEGNEVPATSLYKNPFKGIQYPVIKTDSVSFMTRNYGGQTLNFYTTSDGNEIACSTNYNEIDLWVIDADPKTRRVLAYSRPTDRCWAKENKTYSKEELHYVHPYVELRGWLDEKWICANLLSTCP